jgi:hypothetical protein
MCPPHLPVCAGMLPLLLQASIAPTTAVLACPLFFGAAHLHHAWELLHHRKMPPASVALSVGAHLLALPTTVTDRPSRYQSAWHWSALLLQLGFHAASNHNSTGNGPSRDLCGPSLNRSMHRFIFPGHSHQAVVPGSQLAAARSQPRSLAF